jgi:hypothetical protein
VRRSLALALAGLFIFAGAAQAASYSGTASGSHPFSVSFQTVASGGVVASTTWQPKRGGDYAFEVDHLTNPSDPLSYDSYCLIFVDFKGVTQFGVKGSGTWGNWVCTFPPTLDGYWVATFTTYSGKTSVTLSVP